MGDIRFSYFFTLNKVNKVFTTNTTTKRKKITVFKSVPYEIKLLSDAYAIGFMLSKMGK